MSFKDYVKRAGGNIKSFSIKGRDLAKEKINENLEERRQVRTAYKEEYQKQKIGYARDRAKTKISNAKTLASQRARSGGLAGIGNNLRSSNFESIVGKKEKYNAADTGFNSNSMLFGTSPKAKIQKKPKDNKGYVIINGKAYKRG